MPQPRRPPLLREEAIQDSSKQRAWIVLPALFVAVAALLLYFLLIGLNRDAIITFAVARFGDSAEAVTPTVLILLAFPIFLGPTLFGAHRSDQIKTTCPLCDTDISSKVHQLLVTRCCPACGEQAVAGGTVRTVAVYKRYRAIHSRAFLKYWFWAWPAFGLLTCTIWLIDHNALQQCPQSYILAPLIGTATTGWASIRTLNFRYILPLCASVAVLCLGAAIFWHSI